MSTHFHSSRFLVGIDLGTTNTTLSYIDRRSDNPEKIHHFFIEQTVAAGEAHKRKSLPSFYFLPPDRNVSGGRSSLNWEKSKSGIAGTYARDHGASLPDRFIFSAKSWLAHSGVDRKASILPWGSKIDVEKLSPVKVSEVYLSHLIHCWNNEFGEYKDGDGSPCNLEEQQVVLTVPASFDEIARELTVEAAVTAGLKHLTLIEEPLAAFYCWLAKTKEWKKHVSPGETVLVVDIGGGTTDFSLISLEKGETLRRTAVGNHLLLGGDNMDMAIAKTLETRWKRSLGPKEWGALCQESRKAKERLLSEDAPFETQVSLHLGGSSVVGSTLVTSLNKEDVLQIIMEGFFPHISITSSPLQKKSGLRDMGLPYEKDPAITKHLFNFLKMVNPGRTDHTKPLIPDTVLFNGGVTLPKKIREKVLAVINSWSNEKNASQLEAWDLGLAVSTGAAYHALVKAGRGVKVHGGISRAYYIEVQGKPSSRLVCIMPRDTEEGVKQSLSSHKFTVRTNEQVRFLIAGSATRLHDSVGAVIDEEEEITPLPPLQTVIRFGKQEARLVEVTLSTLLNETGTMEIWINSVSTDHRWQLKFDLRALHTHSKKKSADFELDNPGSVTITEKQMTEAEKIIDGAFSSKEALPSLIKDLEACFELKRESWSLTLIRRIFDFLLTRKDVCKQSFLHEARWLNLTGYTLRPGFGDTTDVWRVKQLWPLWLSGPSFPQNGQVNAEWWVLWRRVSGGLSKGHQNQLGSSLLKTLCQKKKRGKKQTGTQDVREMWRCLGSLELLQVREKVRAAEHLFSSYSRLDKAHNWALGRMGARNLVYGTADLVIPAKEASKWVEKIMKMAKKPDDESVHFALRHIAEYCGEKNLDLPEALKTEIEKFLQNGSAPPSVLQGLWKRVAVTAKEDEKVLGDSLPIGLHLHGESQEEQSRPSDSKD
ncbi:MAG: Hsp70 family protein [Nitrospinota bacterium]